MAKVYWSCLALSGCMILCGSPLRAEILLPPQASTRAGVLPSSQSQPPGTEFDEARRLSQQGKYNEAISALHQLESAHPDLKGVSHELGAAYYKMGDYANGIEFLKTS